MKKLMFVFAAMVATSVSAGAQQVACQNVSEANLGVCLAKERATLDLELNRTYKVVLAKLNPEQQKALRASERAWIQCRDTDLALEEALITGGNHPEDGIDYDSLRILHERIAFLKRLDLPA